jgi:hypothetical protein
MYLPLGRLLSKFFLLTGGPSSFDLVGAGREGVELQMGYPSEIQPPSSRVRSRRAIPLGVLDPLGASR